MSTETDNTVVEVAAEQPSKPLLRVIKGDLTEEELAALVAVVAARSAAAMPTKPKPRSEWGHPVRAVRGPHRPGPDAWRRSAWA
ncbi:MAG TPA: acyl-CoA carboxylase epsilon subunit [Aeromicrobium sp.]|nr:acyl-CoA carboxylase epsilon subunit [Aeromicrobium sp.]